MTDIAPISPRASWIQPNGQPTQVFWEFIRRLWIRSGGSNDSFSDLSVENLFQYNTLNNGGTEERDIFVTSSDITTTGNAIVIATSNITVTLNTLPEDGEFVTVNRSTTAGNVTVSGTINGDLSHTILFNYESYDFIYSAENGEWSIV